jgi:hypothetical protein
MPDQLFSLTLPEFWAMVDAKLYYNALDQDIAMQRLAWQTSLLMSATGNYGKKGVKADKLYKSHFDENGEPIQTNDGTFKTIDKDEKDKKLNELMKKFNKK